MKLFLRVYQRIKFLLGWRGLILVRLRYKAENGQWYREDCRMAVGDMLVLCNRDKTTGEKFLKENEVVELTILE